MKKNHTKKIPFAYHITFRTYSTWLHGDPRSSVDPEHNVYGTPRIKPNSGLHQAMKEECNEDEFIMNAQQRETVLKSIIHTCDYNHWHLYATHVRTNHLHSIIKANIEGKKVMTTLKIYATKHLKSQHGDIAMRKRFWAKGGSAEHIWIDDDVFSVMDYVIERQGGKKMAVYHDGSYGNIYHADF